MSSLQEVQEKLQDTYALIARLEREAGGRPPSAVQEINLQSLEKRLRRLETEYATLTAAAGLDVCHYRFLSDPPRPRLAGLAAALGDFQTLVSVFYDAIHSRQPKQTTKLSAEAAAQTAFEFGYAYAGSVGFALTMSNERLLLTETDLDEAVRVIFEVARARTTDEVSTHARQLGPAPIRVLYRWAEDHVKASFTADIEWRRGEEVRTRVLIQVPEFESLRAVISQTSEENREEITLAGELVGADVTRRSFHIRPDEGADIRGRFVDTISTSQTVELPRRYRFTIIKTAKIHYSTEEEDVSYELIRLDPVAGGPIPTVAPTPTTT